MDWRNREKRRAAASLALAVLVLAGAGNFGAVRSFAASAGSASAAAVPAEAVTYKALTNAYRLREPFLMNSTDENGRSRTEAVDRGDCFELTNVLLFAYVKYGEDEVKSAGVGDTLKVNGKVYEVAEISEDGIYTLERKDGTGYSAREYLRPVNTGKNKKGYYIAYRGEDPSDESFDSADLYYTGSVFIRKDCPVLAVSLAEDGTLPAVSAETYLTGDRASFGADGAFRYGRSGAEQEVTLNGRFTLDEAGYIVTYTEKY